MFLKDFKDDELEIMEVTLDRAVDAIESFLKDGIILTMSRFNGPAELG